ncbi:MAG: gamma-glutamyl-gamma-aminobutyrate hydrolase family protein [Deltaproteobacteria bacterium]|nr:gamma-glutamyl-gamma-aminobutyrate hydrolase family protein [Deltaproteobacteria bacterium]
MKRPVVLLPPDLDVRQTKRGPLAVMITQRPYTSRILEAGGLPLVMPPVDEDGLDQLIALADALVLPGGGFDIDPQHYGEAQLPACGELKPERTDLEWGLLVRAERKGIPVLGICGGMQLMNVVRGGALFQDIPSQKPSALVHSQEGPKRLPSHVVDVVATSQLARLVGAGPLPVNSTHHQGIKHLGRDLTTSATAPDGLVEGIEDRSQAFFVGVQWHPESMEEEPHRAIYRAMIDACR